MKTLRTASFWISALILPGGMLLLMPMVLRALRKQRAARGKRTEEVAPCALP